MVPNSTPQHAKEKALATVIASGVVDRVALVGIRGYYRDSMGEKGKNDRGIYDDAMILLTPNVYASFNANTDPSVFRKGIATLKCGVHLYKKGNHGISKPNGGYPALRPANREESLPVTRDGENDGFGIAINIHKGNHSSTSSAGCQTIYPNQWDAFIALVYSEMKRYNQKIIPYVLTENRNT